jgi:hypothetical protein
VRRASRSGTLPEAGNGSKLRWGTRTRT